MEELKNLQSRDDLERLKIKAEIDKIKAEESKVALEEAEIRKPWYRQSSFLNLLITVLLPVVTITAGYFLGGGKDFFDAQKERLEYQKEKLQDDIARDSSYRKKLITENDSIAQRSERIRAENEAMKSSSVLLELRKEELEKSNHALAGKFTELSNKNESIEKANQELTDQTTSLKAERDIFFSEAKTKGDSLEFQKYITPLITALNEYFRPNLLNLYHQVTCFDDDYFSKVHGLLKDGQKLAEKIAVCESFMANENLWVPKKVGLLHSMYSATTDPIFKQRFDELLESSFRGLEAKDIIERSQSVDTYSYFTTLKSWPDEEKKALRSYVLRKITQMETLSERTSATTFSAIMSNCDFKNYEIVAHRHSNTEDLRNLLSGLRRAYTGLRRNGTFGHSSQRADHVVYNFSPTAFLLFTAFNMKKNGLTKFDLFNDLINPEEPMLVCFEKYFPDDASMEKFVASKKEVYDRLLDPDFTSYVKDPELIKKDLNLIHNEP